MQAPRSALQPRPAALPPRTSCTPHTQQQQHPSLPAARLSTPQSNSGLLGSKRCTQAAAAAVEAPPSAASTSGSGERFQAELGEVYPVSAEAVEHYRTQGFVRLHGVFSPPLLEEFDRVVTEAVAQVSDGVSLEDDDDYACAFKQVMNIWEQNADVRQLVFSRRLASIAAQLLEVDGVRIYHDQALYKQPGGGCTPWHADAYYWPLDSDRVVTAWVPLQAVPPTMGPLEFAATSHRNDIGRHLGISADSERQIQRAVSAAGYAVNSEAFQLGEVSFHSGWTFHRAEGNSTQHPRKVMTVIYMDKDIKMIEPQHANHRADHERWLPGVKPGEVAASHRNPVVYQL